MRHVCMAKLSQQLLAGDERRTRTERLLEKQEGEAQPVQRTLTREEAIDINIEKVDERIEYAQQRIKDAEEDHEKDLEDIRKKRNQRPEDADYYDKKEDDIDDKLEEKQQYWLGYISGLKQAKSRLSQGEYLEYKDITGYATDIAQYERDVTRAQNREREYNKTREQKVKALEEQGYQPILIQEYDKGQLQSEKVTFYNPKLSTYADYSIPLTTKAKSISGLSVSQLGRTEVSRTLTFGGKEYTFKTQEQLYKTPSGKLTTQLGGLTERTETQIIESAKQKAYQEYLKESPEVKLGKESEPTLPDDRKWYEKSLDELFIQPAREKVKAGASSILGYGKKGLEVVDKYVRWDFRITGTGKGIPKVQLISFGKQEQAVDVEKQIEGAQLKLGEVAFDIKEAQLSKQLGTDVYSEFKETKEEQAKEQVSSLFYRSEIGKEAFFKAQTEEDLEKAFEQYKITEEFKQYEIQYAEGYQKDLDKLLEDVDYTTKLKGTYAGIKIAGIGLGSVGLSLVKSPARLGLTAGTLYAGGYALSSLPTSTLVTLDVAFLTAGATKVLSKSSSIEERGAGAVMVALAGTSLTLKGIAYARSPTVKYREIKAPKISVKASETIGKDVKIITKDGTITKVIYPKQKLSQFGVAGRRTIVSTKIRDLLKIKPVYEGVPYADRGIYTLKSMRGTYQVALEKSGYTKAYELLTKRGGYTPYQARATLRYYQPRVIEQYLERGIITIKGTTAKGEFTYLTKQPVIKVDEALGIKTRGARTIKDIFDVERKILTIRKGYSLAVEEKTLTSFYLKRGASPFDIKDLEYSRGLIIGKGTELKKGYEPIKIGKDLKYYREVEYKDIGSISFTRKLLPSENIIRIDARRSKLIQEIIDLTKDQYKIYPTGIKKTPFAKTFGTERTQEIKAVIKDIGIKDKGSGQITKQVSNILKDAVSPPKISVKSEIKNLIKTDTAVKVGIKSTAVTSLASIGVTRQREMLKAILKERVGLINENALKQEISLKQIAIPKMAQLSQSKLIQQEVLDVASPSLLSPTISTPVISPPLPTIPVIPLYFPPAKTKGKKKSLKKQIQDLAYLPDFTARALGLEAETITEKQARAKLKKLLTGFEIRRPVKLI